MERTAESTRLSEDAEGLLAGPFGGLKPSDVREYPALVPVRSELEVLVRHWLRVDRELWAQMFRHDYGGSQELRETAFAERRFARIAELLDDETVLRLQVEEAAAFCFVSGVDPSRLRELATRGHLRRDRRGYIIAEQPGEFEIMFLAHFACNPEWFMDFVIRAVAVRGLRDAHRYVEAGAAEDALRADIRRQAVCPAR